MAEKNKKEKMNLYLLAIVAIVAGVGIVVLVLNSGIFSSDSSLIVDENGDVVGMAYGGFKKIKNPGDFMLISGDAEQDVVGALEAELGQTEESESADNPCGSGICCKYSTSGRSCLKCVSNINDC